MFTCRTSANIVVLSFLILLSTTAKAESEAVMKQLNYSGYELMTRLVNDSRKLNGRPKLCTSQYICRLIMGNRKLMNSAQKHSDYQASIRRMTHESPTPLFDRFTQAGFKAQAVAENVAMMSSFTVEGVMRLWIGSPGTSIQLNNARAPCRSLCEYIGRVFLFGKWSGKGQRWTILLDAALCAALPGCR